MNPVEASQFVNSAQAPLIEELARRRAEAQAAYNSARPLDIVNQNYTSYMDPSSAISYAVNDSQRLAANAAMYQAPIDAQKQSAAEMLQLLIQAQQQKAAEADAASQAALRSAQIAQMQNPAKDNAMQQEYDFLKAQYGEEVAKKMIQSKYGDPSMFATATPTDTGSGTNWIGDLALLAGGTYLGKKLLASKYGQAAVAKLTGTPAFQAAKTAVTGAGTSAATALNGAGIAVPTTAVGTAGALAAGLTGAYYGDKAIMGAKDFITSQLANPVSASDLSKNFFDLGQAWDTTKYVAGMPGRDLVDLWNRYSK